jgi:hypothetical protein
VLMVGTMVLACLLVAHLWPFSRPAVLIPVAWWAMYLVNRRKVSAPVLGLIDAAAEKAGFYPVPAGAGKKQEAVEEKIPAALPAAGEKREADPIVPELDSDEGELAVG